MHRFEIPNSVIGPVAEALGKHYYSHTRLNILFMESGAPGDPPEGNCFTKCMLWLKRCNNDQKTEPLTVLGNVLQQFMDRDQPGEEQQRICRALAKNGLSYQLNGRILIVGPPASAGEKSWSPDENFRGTQGGCIQSSVTLFYAYSHRDEGLRDELETHLSLLKRQGIIESWHDRRISAGREWERQIDESLERSQIVLLLISADFLASDYCYDREMKRALEKHAANEAHVIPVILRAVDWHGAPFSKLQALPRDGKPVTSWSNRDEAWTDVSRGIRKAAEGLLVKPAAATTNANATRNAQMDNFDTALGITNRDQSRSKPTTDILVGGLRWHLVWDFSGDCFDMAPEHMEHKTLGRMLRGPLCRACSRDVTKELHHGNKCVACGADLQVWEPGKLGRIGLDLDAREIDHFLNELRFTIFKDIQAAILRGSLDSSTREIELERLRTAGLRSTP